jgi:4-amino-4-deoxy-L-arabinose transferase-like glycosyltransferase
MPVSPAFDIAMRSQQAEGFGATPKYRLRLELRETVPVFTKSAAAAFGLGVVLFVAARVWRLTIYSLRPDDIFSLRAARLGWTDLIDFVVKDVVHPPLFYLLLKIWIGIGGESQLWLRLFPVLAAVAAIVPFFLLCRELKLRAAEINLALMLMAVNGYLIYHAQEVRMYSLLLFFTLWSLWLFIKFFNAEHGASSYLAVLLGVNLLLVYSQYYGWLIVGMELAFLLAWGRDKLSWFLLSLAALILCFIPWAYRVAQVAAERGLESNIGSFQRPNLITDLAAYYVILTAPLRPLWITFLGLMLLGYSFLSWVSRIFSGSESEDKREVVFLQWLLLFSFLPSILSFCVSQIFSQSVWGTRFLIIVVVPYIILVAVTLCRLPRGWPKNTGVLFVVGWASLAGFQAVHHSNKNAWELVIHQMIAAEPSQATGVMICSFGSSDEVIDFYLEKAREKRFQTKRIKDVDDMDGKHFWVALRESFERPPQQILIERGYRVGTEYRDGFDGLLFPVWRQ